MGIKETASSIRKEWFEVRKAPFTILAVAVIGCAGGWFAGRVFYQQQIATLRDMINSKETLLGGKDDLLKGKDDLLQDYRERLGLVPRDRTKFSKMTNAELLGLALEVVADIHRFADAAQRNLDEYREQVNRRPKTGEENEEGKRFLDVFHFGERQITDFDERFAGQVWPLQEEITHRLPDSAVFQSRCYMMDPNGMHSVAIELERHARLLP